MRWLATVVADGGASTEVPPVELAGQLKVLRAGVVTAGVHGDRAAFLASVCTATDAVTKVVAGRRAAVEQQLAAATAAPPLSVETRRKLEQQQRKLDQVPGRCAGTVQAAQQLQTAVGAAAPLASDLADRPYALGLVLLLAGADTGRLVRVRARTSRCQHCFNFNFNFKLNLAETPLSWPPPAALPPNYY